ncbi:hypothetical protein LSCM1_02756 [Leishmania martiniquensis]|uniref:DNA repair protein RAD51 homolog 3 n=1 Tax=Leishmania martiniquensis TaxID=1580590 RepID=A0A836GT97_9TRYP|nr:hypothetical protein LSCM1_02756 [Leishmania martiniquensis]
MALIECSELLSSSTKAKLQDAGILYVSDAVALFSSNACRTGGSSDSQLLSAVRHFCTTSRHDTLQNDARPRRRQKPGAAGDGVDFSDAPSGSASAETAMRSTLSNTASLSRLLKLTEDEVHEIAEMAARTAMVAQGEVERRNGRTLGAQGSELFEGVAPSSPLEPPASPPRPAETAQNTCEDAHAFDGRSCTIPGCRTLLELYAEARARQAQGFPTHVTTFSRELDRILGGGVPVGGVTEISGPPGVGKTQLLMQLAVSCTMPVEFGGMGGACLFVDTEGSFVVERLEQMATAAVSLVRAILLRQRQLPRSETAAAPSLTLRQPAESSKKRNRSPPLDLHTALPQRDDCEERGGAPAIEGDFSVESVLQRVHYVRVTDLAGLLALLHSLTPWLEEDRKGEASAVVSTGSGGMTAESSRNLSKSAGGARTPVRMVLVDSIALPFRSFEGFHRGGLSGSSGGDGDGAMNLLGYAEGTAAHKGLSMQSSKGLWSRQGLWRRSRLLFQCSTLLEQLAGAYQLAIVVTNHMTTKTLRSPASQDATCVSAAQRTGCSAADGEANGGHHRLSILVPALGDAWGQGLSTRLLLSFHHYDLPPCCFVAQTTAPTAANECMEDVVYSLTAAPHQPPTALRSVAQHRVVRVLKCSGQPRREACFLITSKGIRDAPKELASRLAETSAGAGQGHP